MTKKRRAIILDLDDTIVDFLTCLTKLYNAKHGTCISPADLTSWDFKDISMKDARGNEVDGKNLREFFIEYENHGLYAALPVIEEAKRAIDFAKDLGYRIFIMTARNEKFKIATEINLIMHGIQYDKLICDWDKVKRINELSEKYDIEVFADDKYATVKAVKDKCDVKYCLLVSKGHNLSIEEDKGITRISTIFEMSKLLTD